MSSKSDKLILVSLVLTAKHSFYNVSWEHCGSRDEIEWLLYHFNIVNFFKTERPISTVQVYLNVLFELT